MKAKGWRQDRAQIPKEDVHVEDPRHIGGRHTHGEHHISEQDSEAARGTHNEGL